MAESTGLDVGAFVMAWESGSADVNFDCAVDGAEVAMFHEYWENGCSCGNATNLKGG